MDHDIFARHLSDATATVIALTRGMIVESLPDSVLYYVFVNPDGWPYRQPFEIDEEIYPEDFVPARMAGLSADLVISRLWHHGRVPRSIYIMVESHDNNNTYVTLECCGRFTASDEIRHTCEGYPPFHCTGYKLPSN